MSGLILSCLLARTLTRFAQATIGGESRNERFQTAAAQFECARNDVVIAVFRHSRASKPEKRRARRNRAENSRQLAFNVDKKILRLCALTRRPNADI